ncbi:MAG: LuxR C-terminal-related transcriptional regulator [Pseudomonadota bacterium]
MTKLTAGRMRSGLVARPRLAPRAEDDQFKGLTLVCAQAGYGKTTLVASWLQAGAEQAAWLSLDRDDNDALRFLAHLLAAIRTQVAHFETELAGILQSPNPPPIAVLMTGFINALAGLGQRIVLVLDDYHLITNQAVHDALLFLLDHQPDNVHLIMISREEPPFSLARLQSHGRLLRFMETDLCFTPQEAEDFFNRVMSLGLSQQQSDTLRAHTEGWAAGLQMAALSLSKVHSKADFIAGFSGKERHVIDFLADEVLLNQSEAIQSFLMRTSILDSFNAGLCQFLTGTADSQAMLLHLERNHMFLVPLDTTREWYRYHHLFAELLQSRLAKTQPGQVFELHSLAAQWYAAHDLPADALRHARLAQDMDLVARILDRHAINMFALGEVRTVAGWLSILPEAVALQYPDVALLTAFNMYFQPLPDVALAERCLAAIDGMLADQHTVLQDRQGLAGKVAVVRGYQARFAGQADLSLEFFNKASELLPNSDVFYDIAMINLAILHAALGRLDDATAILSRYAGISDAQPHLWITMTGIFGLSRTQLMRGRLELAASICVEGLRQFHARGLNDMPVCSMLHLQLGEIAYLQNRLKEASAQAGRALELARAGGMELNQGCSQVLLARVALARGEVDEVGALEPQYEQRLLGYWATVSLIIPPLSGYLAQLWLAQGRVRELNAWFAQRGIAAQSLKPEWEMEGLVLARLLLQQRRTEEAFALLSRLLSNAETDQRHGAAIGIMILQALARHAEDKPASAAEFLCRALALAQAEQQLRPFLDAGSGVQFLLQRMAVPAALADFAARVLASFDTIPPAPQSNENLAPVLSGKEEKVARLLAAGLSNHEIAARLFVSPNTIKFHVKSLYRKLGVSKRYDAIQKIRG